MFHSAVRKLAVLAAAAPLALVAPAPAHAGSPVPAIIAARLMAQLPVPARQLMSQLVTKTNQQRWAAGCGLLGVDQELIIASVQQSEHMALTGDFNHVWLNGSTFVSRSRSAGYLQPTGENLAFGYTTADQVIAAWMASPDHRANMLDCTARSIGTGVTFSADGTPYYTQLFGRI
ncbi:CAP domain-containing protein [Krasilnikovia sp. MM14-A1259]|uniref:CAP domain-containing protein n=1 Tax=Krasilnikovia sp. MM14-A1259 TaxID=3373539 RepID=UPI0037F26C74